MPTIIAVASGKGGVGKSVTASNLALQFSHRGKKVVLVDLDIGGANLHVLFGVFTPKTSLSDFLERKVERLDQTVEPISWAQGLGFIPGTANTLTAGNLLHSKKQRLIRHLRNIDADIVILDCAPGTNYHTLDFYLSADRQVTVATPDPTSILEVYRFIKLAAIRRVLTTLSSRIHVDDKQEIVNREFASIDDVLAAFQQTEPAQREAAVAIMRQFHPYLIMNRINQRAKFSTASLQQVILNFLGTELIILGEIPQDPNVEQSVRHYLPVTDRTPQTPASVALRQTFYALEQRLTAADTPRTSTQPTLARSVA